MRLNIIGNGFDLYHGLPSSYYYFSCFVANNHPEFYQEMSDMYDFSAYKRVGHEDFEINIDNLFWSAFEEKLGKLNPLWMEESLLDDLGLECDDPIDIDIPERGNAERIKDLFSEWIRKTVNTEVNYEIVRRKLNGRKCKFGIKDFFINFNYTQLLQDVYKIV